MKLSAKSKSVSNFSLSKVLLGALALSFFYFLFFGRESLFEIQGLGLLSFSESWATAISKTTSIVLFVVSIFLVNRLAASHKLPEEVDVVTWLYPFFIAVGLTEVFTSPELFISLLLSLLSLSVLLNIHQQNNVLKEVFLASLFSGLAALFFAPSLLFLLLTFAAILLFRPFELRSYLLSLIGGALPFFYFFGIAYVFEIEVSPLEMEFTFPGESILAMSWMELLLDGILLILGLVATFYTLSIQSKQVVRKRNQLSLLMTFLSLSVVLSVFYFQQAIGFLSLSLACSFCYAWFYQSLKRRWVLDLILFLLLALKWWVELGL